MSHLLDETTLSPWTGESALLSTSDPDIQKVSTVEETESDEGDQFNEICTNKQLLLCVVNFK